jgi:AcrR family transcriptional regulator
MTDRKSISHDESKSNEQALDDSIRQRITAEARRQFFSLGIRAVTMDDLAYNLGMSKRTLYEHFATKADLVEATFRDKFFSIEEELTRISAESSSDCFRALSQLLACLERHLEELQPPLMRDIRREAPKMFALVESNRSDMINRHLGKIIDGGRKAGIIRADIPGRLIIEIILGAVQAIVNPEKLTELDLKPKESIIAILKVIFEGAMTEGQRVTQKR